MLMFFFKPAMNRSHLTFILTHVWKPIMWYISQQKSNGNDVETIARHFLTKHSFRQVSPTKSLLYTNSTDVSLKNHKLSTKCEFFSVTHISPQHTSEHVIRCLHNLCAPILIISSQFIKEFFPLSFIQCLVNNEAYFYDWRSASRYLFVGAVASKHFHSKCKQHATAIKTILKITNHRNPLFMPKHIPLYFSTLISAGRHEGLRLWNC